jgi:hypothetical protein
MAEGYVIQATDTVGTTKDGYPSLRKYTVTEFLHTRKTREDKGI